MKIHTIGEIRIGRGTVRGVVLEGNEEEIRKVARLFGKGDLDVIERAMTAPEPDEVQR